MMMIKASKSTIRHRGTKAVEISTDTHQNKTMTMNGRMSINQKLASVTAIATIFLALITALYVFFTYGMLKEIRRNGELTQEPLIVLGRNDMYTYCINYETKNPTLGEKGKYNLYISNKGIPDVIDVNLYIDPFVATLFAKNDQLPQDFKVNEKYPYMIFHTPRQNEDAYLMPNKTFGNIRRGQELVFKCDISDSLNTLIRIKNGLPMLRITIKYRRAVDYKECVLRKYYVIKDGGEKLLSEFNYRGMDVDNWDINGKTFKTLNPSRIKAFLETRANEHE